MEVSPYEFQTLCKKDIEHLQRIHIDSYNKNSKGQPFGYTKVTIKPQIQLTKYESQHYTITYQN